MPLRFAIIKVLETKVGNFLENVVYEHEDKEVFGNLWDNFKMIMHEDKHKPRFGEKKWTEAEVLAALEKAWKKTITDFKKVTIRIL
jgi:hypothetical protein